MITDYIILAIRLFAIIPLAWFLIHQLSGKFEGNNRLARIRRITILGAASLILLVLSISYLRIVLVLDGDIRSPTNQVMSLIINGIWAVVNWYALVQFRRMK